MMVCLIIVKKRTIVRTARLLEEVGVRSEV